MTSKVYFLYVLKFSGSFVKISEFVQSQWMSFSPMRGGGESPNQTHQRKFQV